MKMNWTVTVSKRAAKRIAKLPKQVRTSLFTLLAEIENKGPVRGNWPNYSKLDTKRHHCHLKKGQQTYVAVWQVVNNEIKLVEVIYAGTHEKAPY
jgi:mRNA-degrading endonuclease RelE of RelBE toxin-antitoxin system